MKKTLLCCILTLSSICAFAQTPARVEVRIEDRRFYVKTEWRTNVYADLFDAEDNPVPPSTQYFFRWERIINDSAWIPLMSGYGYWTGDPDGHYWDPTRIRVTVRVSPSDSYVRLNRGNLEDGRSPACILLR